MVDGEARVTAEENPLGREIQRLEFHVSFKEEAVLIERDLEHCRDIRRVILSNQRGGQHHQIRGQIHILAHAQVIDAHLAVFHRGRPTTDHR